MKSSKCHFLSLLDQTVHICIFIKKKNLLIFNRYYNNCVVIPTWQYINTSELYKPFHIRACPFVSEHIFS